MLKDLANKEQRGFVSPSEFNTMAPIAQTTIYNNMWKEVLAAETMRSRNMNPQRGLSKTNDVREELSMYMKSSTRERDTDLKFTYPDDYYKLISLKTYGQVLLGVTTSTPIEVTYDPHRIDYMLQSTLSAPSIGKPVALVADKLEIYPNSIRKVDLRYYKLPEGITTAGAPTTAQPEYGFTTVAGDEVYDAGTSIDFELPEDREDQLVRELAEMIGVALRDGALINYGSQPAQ